MIVKKSKTYLVVAGILVVATLLTTGAGLIQATEDSQPEPIQNIADDEPEPIQAIADDEPEPMRKVAVDMPDLIRASADNNIKYIVQAGDTLWGIARDRQVAVALLAEINDLPLHGVLLAGREIRIPRGSYIPHMVVAGEDLWAIAHKYNIEINDIISENRLENPDNLPAGEEILIPVSFGQSIAGAALAKNNWLLPLWPTFGVVSSIFGPRDGRSHEGMDIAASEGTPVRAVKGGQVVFAGERGTYGQTVIINHGGGLRTLYAHNSEIVVHRGEVVAAGREIARVGNTGRSTGPHLHFELLYRGMPVNPARYLPEKN